VLNQASRHEDELGRGSEAPRFLNLGFWWKWVISVAPRPLCTLGKSPRCPLDSRLGGWWQRTRVQSLLLPAIEFRSSCPYWMNYLSSSSSKYWVRE